jgi:hypothetical protein
VHHDEAMHQMSNDRKCDQFELPLEDRGATPRGKRSGEVVSAMRGDVRSGNDDSMAMERVVERGNLLRALKRVRRNKGSPGVDGVTVEELPEYLRKHWPVVREQLLAGRYQRGVGGIALSMAARFARNWWHLSAHKALHIALPGRYFESLGVPRLASS